MNYRTNFNSTFANRGMGLENDINETNKYYIDYDIALIFKKPTPIRITKTDYKNLRITDGFFECPSTLDYNGVYKGYYIEFDAKETRSTTSFTINNIHKHQIDYIKKVLKQCNIEPYFNCVLSGEMFVKSKPDPEIYNETCKRLGIDKKDILVVEDSPYGIEAAKSAGLKVVGIVNKEYKVDLSKADYIVNSLEEINSFI